MQNDVILTPIFLEIVGEVVLFEIAGKAIGLAQVLSTATLIAGTVALNYALAPKAPKAEDGTVPVRQPIPPRFAGFGEVRLAGAYALYESIGGTSFDNMGLCQGPAGGFKRFYIDDRAVTTTVQTTPYDPAHGNVNMVDMLSDGAYGPFVVMINVRFGAALETAIQWTKTDLMWTQDHRGDRVAQVELVCLGVNQETFPKIYPHGLPKLSAVVYLPCWDFRDGDQEPDDPDTWIDYAQYSDVTTYAAGDRVLDGGLTLAESDGSAGGMLWLCMASGTVGVTPGTDARKWTPVWKNPVLQAATYLISQEIGMGLPRARLITPALAALTIEAAKCDVAIQRKDGNWEPRYSACPWFRLDTEPEQVLGQIFAACDGWVGLDGIGSLSIKVGVYAVPTITLDEDVILGVELDYGVGDEERIDEMTLTFTSPEHDYTTQDIAPWRNEEAILARGKIRTQPFGPMSVQSHSQLARLAKKLMLRANAQRGNITTNLGGLVAAGQRYVTIDYPAIPELDGVVVEIRSRQTSIAERRCSFDFVVIDPTTIDAWDRSTEEPDPPSNADRTARETLPIPQNLAGIAVGTPPFHIDLNWDAPDRVDLDYRVRFRNIAGVDPSPWSETNFADPTIIGDRIFVTIYPPNSDLYEIQAASVGSRGSLSEWSDPIFVSTVVMTLDFSLPQNSGYLALTEDI